MHLEVEIHEDKQLLNSLSNITMLGYPSHHNTTRVSHTLHRSNGLPSIQFSSREIDILSDQRAWLNDVCINGSAALLQNFFSAPTAPSFVHSHRCAILSTFVLVNIRKNAANDALWDLVKTTQYWSKDVWILPIHRKQPLHWVLCCISCRTHEIFLFDSLAERQPWVDDIQYIITMIERLVLLANMRGYRLHLILEDWVARPLLVRVRCPHLC